MKVKTTPTTQSLLVECRVCKTYKVTHQVSNFYCLLEFRKVFKLFGIGSQTFGARYDKDSVPWYTVLTDLVVKVRLLLIS